MTLPATTELVYTPVKCGIYLLIPPSSQHNSLGSFLSRSIHAALATFNDIYSLSTSTLFFDVNTLQVLISKEIWQRCLSIYQK